ncbi:hypothetical protein ACLOJK_035292 [Asimina triloba]
MPSDAVQQPHHLLFPFFPFDPTAPSRSALPAANAPTSSPPASETHLHPATSSDRPRAELITPKSGQQLHDWPSSICNHGSPSMLHASGEQPVQPPSRGPATK